MDFGEKKGNEGGAYLLRERERERERERAIIVPSSGCFTLILQKTTFTGRYPFYSDSITRLYKKYQYPGLFMMTVTIYRLLVRTY
jgi:hypothetical protein